jgi:formamidopyrimidine-DNA glycosylase
MPELPEVEHLRRSIDPWIVGAHITTVAIRRKSVVTLAEKHARTKRSLEQALGAGSTVVATHRHGKQMAVEFASGGTIVIQLGMTGGVTIDRDRAPSGMDGRHRHVVWEIQPTLSALAQLNNCQPPAARWLLAFRDPRRFGGITAFPSMDALRASWSKLGPDALTISPTDLHRALCVTSRPVKAALLDQSMIAGVGNIYADESLFAAKIHPMTSARILTPNAATTLSDAIRRILQHAVICGGSTLRDYKDAFGRPGMAVQSHAAYGRAGMPCVRCAETLLGTRLQGRATVNCPRCQELSTRSTTTTDA